MLCHSCAMLASGAAGLASSLEAPQSHNGGAQQAPQAMRIAGVAALKLQWPPAGLLVGCKAAPAEPSRTTVGKVPSIGLQGTKVRQQAQRVRGKPLGGAAGAGAWSLACGPEPPAHAAGDV